jgi:hypothetical protein
LPLEFSVGALKIGYRAIDRRRHLRIPLGRDPNTTGRLVYPSLRQRAVRYSINRSGVSASRRMTGSEVRASISRHIGKDRIPPN